MSSFFSAQSAASSTDLPNWDLTSLFPSLDSPQFAAEFDGALDDIKELAALSDRFQVRRREGKTVDADWAEKCSQVLNAVNALHERLGTLGAYLGCLTTTNARDEAAKARESQLEARGVQLSQLQTRLVAWIGSSDIETLLQLSAVARAHEAWVRRAQVMQSHLMSEDEENLAAALRPMGANAWAKLHGDLSALLMVEVEIEGQIQSMPMSSVRALATHPNREVRLSAFAAELKAWPQLEIPLAAALNGIKGFNRTLREKRHYADDIEPTLLGNRIDAQTLQAMQSACVDSFADFGRYMNLKARALGIEKLAWCDLIAPIPVNDQADTAANASASTWSWQQARQSIEDNFALYSPELEAFARRSFDENWIDVPSREGKVGGAYCTDVRAGESRILMNFDGSFTGVSTLAHELGHAYHNLMLGHRTPLQRDIPMTLAETASIFCETLVFEAASKTATKAERIALLDNALSRNLQVVVDIHSRFLFEKAVFGARGERELAPSELSELMTQAQRDTYGDHVEPLHPYMWAVKGHYYGPNFYNYPYTFGLLFGLGLYARYGQKPDEFRGQYDEFLSLCGMANAKELALRFGIDITQRTFWDEGLNVIRGQIAQLELLLIE